MRSDLPISPLHPAYAGHFPGFALLPGAVLLDHVVYDLARARGLDVRHWSLTTVKFLGVVRPGDALTLEYTDTEGKPIRFTVRAADRIVATGVLTADTSDGQ